MRLAPPDLASFQHILRNLRERDRIELSATEWNFNPDDAASRLLNIWRSSAVLGQVAHLDEPVALFVLAWVTPTTCQAALLATDRWQEVQKPLSRHVARRVLPLLVTKGVKRLECRTWEQHEDARRWLEWFGAREECRIPHWGKNGETFIQYGWNADVHDTTQTDGQPGFATAEHHRHERGAG